MAQKTITRMFDSREHALNAVRDLESAGFSSDDISVIARSDETGSAETTTGSATGTKHSDTGEKASSGAGIGASLGTLVGGGAGVAAALGAIAIPGIGPVVAAGALVAALTGAGVGAAAGGLIGSLTGAGVSEAEAPVYAEGMRRGGSIVSVRADDAREGEVLDILSRHQPVNMTEREASYREGGWTGYDDKRDTPYVGPAGSAGDVIDPARPGDRRI
ncbi:hypothetical protein ACFOD4_11250 [Pseudoroseomonas globiformis]|uniref:General stress protein 17M-like domain-containing protein n=1 Tax=Teichococcus globiformis TaxID=2307229 RepID=A0ABV7FYZ1_9PROT